jgi:hypothetical protein
VLDYPGTISNAVAKKLAEEEFEKYRVEQDRAFRSDFDRFVEQTKILVEGAE